MHEEMIKLFKKSVPRQKKLYQKYMQENKIQNFSYASFKNNNIMLIQIKDHLMTMEEYHYLSLNQIDNMFEFLRQNIIYDSFNKLKKVYEHLNELSNFLSERYNSRDSLRSEISRNNCSYMIDKIEKLKTEFARKKGYDSLQIEKIISFEKVVRKVLYPKKHVFDENKLLYFIENFNFVLHHDSHNNDFNDNFCAAIERAKINIEREKLSYYKNMYSYLSTIKELNLDTEYINNLLEINHNITDKNLIYKKINSMRIDPKTGLRMVEDYTISIDTDVTRKIDDAFSIEKINDSYLLGIHIADVYSLGYFEEDGLEQRGNVDKKKASLTRNKKRNAMTMYVIIDSNGIVVNYKILNTVLKTDANLVYEDIPRLIRNDNVNPELKNVVINLLSVYNLLENSKFPNNPTISNFAYLITSKLMILCCTLYSEQFKKNNIPAIYLCGNSKDNFYSLESDNYYTGFEEYDTYTKVTSPIYDQSSLINQFFVNRYLLPNRNIDEEEEKQLVKRLKPVVHKLNKNSNKIDIYE